MKIIWSEIAQATFVRFMADQAGMTAINREPVAWVSVARPSDHSVASRQSPPESAQRAG